MELSFGEQIKILLKRNNMTIQDLANLYTMKTGMKMSRQNLTQRLNRDNFPEQDMHLFVALLGCSVSIQLTPISGQPAEPAGIPSQAFLTTDRSTAGRNTPAILERIVSSQQSAPSASLSTEEGDSDITFHIPEMFRKQKPVGDINPLTGEEYLTNTVRRHPSIEEYVQVYDQSTHEWSDVREDYFWEFQKNKKQMMGKDYQEPIRI